MKTIICMHTWKDRTKSLQVLDAKVWSKPWEIKSKDTYHNFQTGDKESPVWQWISLLKEMVAACPLLAAFFTLLLIDLFPQLHKISLVCKYISFCGTLWGFCRPSFPPSCGPPECQHTQSSQLCVVCKFAKGAFCLILQVINEDTLQYWPQYLKCTVHLIHSLLGASQKYNPDFKGGHLRCQQHTVGKFWKLQLRLLV